MVSGLCREEQAESTVACIHPTDCQDNTGLEKNGRSQRVREIVLGMAGAQAQGSNG